MKTHVSDRRGQRQGRRFKHGQNDGTGHFACVKAWSERTLFDRGVHPPEDLPDDVIHDVIEVLKNEGVAVDLRAFTTEKSAERKQQPSGDGRSRSIQGYRRLGST